MEKEEWEERYYVSYSNLCEGVRQLCGSDFLSAYRPPLMPDDEHFNKFVTVNAVTLERFVRAQMSENPQPFSTENSFFLWVRLFTVAYDLLMLYDICSPATDILAEMREFIKSQFRRAHEIGIFPINADMVKGNDACKSYSVMHTLFMQRAEDAYETFVETAACDDEFFPCLLFLFSAKHKMTASEDEEMENFMAFCALYPEKDENLKHIDTFIVNYLYTFAKSEVRDKQRLSSFHCYYSAERHRLVEPLLPSYIKHPREFLQWLRLYACFIQRDDSLEKAVKWVFFDENPQPYLSTSENAHVLFARLKTAFITQSSSLPGIIMLLYHLISFMNFTDFRNLFAPLPDFISTQCAHAYFNHFFQAKILKAPSEIQKSDYHIEDQQERIIQTDGAFVQKLLFPLLLHIMSNYQGIEWQMRNTDTNIIMERLCQQETTVPWLQDFQQERYIFTKDVYIEKLYAMIVDDSWWKPEKQSVLMNDCAKLFHFANEKPFLPSIITFSILNFEIGLKAIFNLHQYLCGSESFFVQQVNCIRDEKERLLPPCPKESDFKKQYKTEEEQRKALNAIKKQRDLWKKIDTGMTISCYQSFEPFGRYFNRISESANSFRIMLIGRRICYKFCDESDNTYNYNTIADYRTANSNNLIRRYSLFDRNSDQHPERRLIQKLLDEKNWHSLLFMLYDCKVLALDDSAWIDFGLTYYIISFLQAEIDELAHILGSLILVEPNANIEEVFSCLKQIDWSGEENKYFKRDENSTATKKIVCKKEVFWAYEQGAYRKRKECVQTAFFQRVKNLLEYMFCMTGIADDLFWESYANDTKKEPEKQNFRPSEADFFSKNSAEISLYLLYVTLKLQRIGKK